jgi:hypothetical protein
MNHSDGQGAGGLMADIVNPQEFEGSPKTYSFARIIFILVLIFLISGIGVSLGYRHLELDPIWVLLLIPFCLAMTGALILFYFLNSSASITRDKYKVGGAAAGFLVMFSIFYDLSRGPFLAETSFYKIYQSSLSDRLNPIVDSYNEIGARQNGTINKIADSAIQSLRSTFDQLSRGTYTIESDELPTYLMPMIAGSKKTYFATQYVFPEKFWGQYWAEKYFEENVKAVRRHVDVRRVFIVDPYDGPDQRQILDNLIKRHAENGIPVRLLEKSEYLKNHNDDDLRDILIVDQQVAGILLLNKGGSFNQVEFSVDGSTIDRRQRNFDRLLASSISYDDWKASGK